MAEEAGFETLIYNDVVAFIRAAAAEGGSAEEIATRAANNIMWIERLREAFAAWWREESYSDIFDGSD